MMCNSIPENFQIPKKIDLNVEIVQIFIQQNNDIPNVDSMY